MPSVKKNFAWSTILTATGYIFPLITFPYVTRVLGVEGIGSNQFADGIVSYFTIFSMMGISTIGVREIAKAKADKKKLSRVFTSLFLLNLLTTTISIIALLLMVQYIPSFKSHSNLLYIGVARILCGTLLVEWVFRGLEDFRYITIVSIIVRLLYVASVFIFVRNSNDYITYFLLTTLTIVVTSAINLLHSKKYVVFTIRGLSMNSYLKPFFILGIYAVLSNMYGSFNVIFLGSKCGDIEVGYYSIATKLYILIMSVFSSFTTVMMPRMSSLIADGNKKEFKSMTSKSIDFLLLFCVPVIIVTEVFTPHIIRIIAGIGYEGAIVPMRIVMPLMFVIGYEQIIIIQMLLPLGKDNAILLNSGLGAIFALVLNFLLVPYLASVGSAIVWFGCEIIVAASAQYFVTKYVGYRLPVLKVLKSFITYIPSLIVCIAINKYFTSCLYSISAGCIFIASYALIVEFYILKNRIVIDSFQTIKAHF